MACTADLSRIFVKPSWWCFLTVTVTFERSPILCEYTTCVCTSVRTSLSFAVAGALLFPTFRLQFVFSSVLSPNLLRNGWFLGINWPTLNIIASDFWGFRSSGLNPFICFAICILCSLDRCVHLQVAKWCLASEWTSWCLVTIFSYPMNHDPSMYIRVRIEPKSINLKLLLATPKINNSSTCSPSSLWPSSSLSLACQAFRSLLPPITAPVENFCIAVCSNIAK